MQWPSLFFMNFGLFLRVRICQASQVSLYRAMEMGGWLVFLLNRLHNFHSLFCFKNQHECYAEQCGKTTLLLHKCLIGWRWMWPLPAGAPLERDGDDGGDLKRLRGLFSLKWLWFECRDDLCPDKKTGQLIFTVVLRILVQAKGRNTNHYKSKGSYL